MAGRTASPPGSIGLLAHILALLSDRQADRPLTLAEVARLLNVHVATAFRWGSRGILRDGDRIVMTMFRGGGRWMIMPADLEAFLARLNADRIAPADSTPRSSAARARASEKAEKELERIGM